MSAAREIWKRLEAVHAVTYFAPESAEAAREAGLRGFWMGYFAFRACPLGPVGPAVVVATFANFAPSMVERALPDAWSLADPAELPAVRAAAAARALRRVAPPSEEVAAEVNPLLEAVVEAAGVSGRPLLAANRALPLPDDPVARLWQLCTTLREHRGDGHVAALLAAGIEGCQSHLLLAAEQGVPPEVFLDNRGWDDDQRRAADDELQRRRLLDDGRLTGTGRQLRAEVERITDELAAAPFDAALDDDEARIGLTAGLGTVAEAVLASGTLPFPNPMGLPLTR